MSTAAFSQITCVADDLEAEPRSALQPGQRRLALVAATAAAAAALLGASCLVTLAGQSSQEPTFLSRALGDEQHVYIVRHGDKYSSYPKCPASDGKLCFDEELMGDNPPLTPCGIRQASHTAKWLQGQKTGGIKNIVVSPFTRTLQTALPFAKATGKKLHVEYQISEANQPEGPFREFNIDNAGETVSQIEEAHKLWDLSYGSVPIKTPENYTLYNARVKTAAKVLKERFPPSSGNLAIFTHATTSFSVAYGLCYGEDGSDKLEEFVKGQDAIGPAGVIHVILAADGSCKPVEQTQNVGMEVGCGETEPFKCKFEDFPSWYWAHPQGKGPGKCH
mmetsp:Transcript_10632/g.14679  ORF Transcript_10632/g.14679 Transcript_10632/m.14679 type:complete len:334 (-) Transcript_10632:280-1281(-)